MVKKHSCPDCRGGVLIQDGRDYPWANVPELPFVVWGRHIHTAKLKPIAPFATIEKATAEVRRLKENCTSHDSFMIDCNSNEGATA